MRGFVESAGAAAPFTPEAFAAVRAHPLFREVVETLAAENLDSYGRWTPAERWLFSDLGRAAMTGAAVVLDALQGCFSLAQLIQAARTNRTCSEGRVRHYVWRATANGFLEATPDGGYRPSDAMHAIVKVTAATMVRAVGRLDPPLATAPLHDLAFRRRLSLNIGLNTAARPDLFAGEDKPVLLFLARDGGTRMLEQLIIAQPAQRTRLFEAAVTSRRALAQRAFVSRIHVARLLADGADKGLLVPDGRRVAATPQLSEDVERHYALVLEMARVSVRAALDQAA
ncbi:MAG: hypothetical protein AB1942_23350 [Pseudomonadota bacterium]